MTCKAAALTYAAMGLPVFPVQGKRPFKGTHGFLEATINARQIHQWWQRWPEANVAIPTGEASGWAVLDVDEGHDGLRSYQLLQAMLAHRALDLGRPIQDAVLPSTRQSRTGAGLHFYYRYPGHLRNAVNIVGLSGLDLRAEGGYIIVPPSRHPNGRRYSWLQEREAALFPPALLELLCWRQRPATHEQSFLLHPTRVVSGRQVWWRDPEEWLLRALARAQVGTRHRCALWLACRLIQQAGLSPMEARGYLVRYAQSVPLAEHEQAYPLSDVLGCLHWAQNHCSI